MKKLILLGLVLLFIGCPSAPKNSAIIYISRGEYARAQEQLLIAVKQDPNDYELYCLLAKTKIGLGNWINAVRSFQDAFKIDSLNAIKWITKDEKNISVYWQAFYNAAFALYSEKKYEEALINLDYSKIINPDDVSQYILAGGIYGELDDIESANRAYTKALSIDPDNPEAFYLIGKVLFEKKLYDSSVVYFDNAIKQFQKKYDKVANVIFQNLPDEPSKELKQEIIKLCKTKEDNELDQLIKVKLGFDGGLAAHKRNIELFFKTSDGISQCYYLRGLTYYNQNKNTPALENFLKSLDFMPENLDVLFHIGVALIKSNKYKEAIDYFENVVQLKENDRDAWFYIGACYLQLKNYNKTIEIYEEKVLQLDPEFVDAMTNLASAYQAIGNSKKAYEWLIKADQLQKEQK